MGGGGVIYKIEEEDEVQEEDFFPNCFCLELAGRLENSSDYISMIDRNLDSRSMNRMDINRECSVKQNG